MSITEREALQRLRDQGLQFHTRRQWGSTRQDVYAWRLRNRRISLPVDYGFVHISVTSDAIPEIAKAEYESMRQIEEIGMERFGTGFPYSAAAHDTGRVMMGHPLVASGAHTIDDFGVFAPPGTSLNGRAHAVVLPQNVQDSVTDLQVSAVAAFFAASHRAGLNRLVTGRLHGHREVTAKSCPGDIMWSRMDDANDLLHDYIRHGLPDGGGSTPEDDMPSYTDKVPGTDHNFADVCRAVLKMDTRSQATRRLLREVREAIDTADDNDRQAPLVRKIRRIVNADDMEES